MNFLWKILRNSFILGAGFFFSTWNIIPYDKLHDFQQLIIFMGIYFIAELSHYYKIKENEPKAVSYKTPMIF